MAVPRVEVITAPVESTTNNGYKKTEFRARVEGVDGEVMGVIWTHGLGIRAGQVLEPESVDEGDTYNGIRQFKIRIPGRGGGRGGGGYRGPAHKMSEDEADAFIVKHVLNIARALVVTAVDMDKILPVAMTAALSEFIAATGQGGVTVDKSASTPARANGYPDDQPKDAPDGYTESGDGRRSDVPF